MKFMVELGLKAGKDKAFELFESRGPNRHPGVTFRGAWIGTDSDIAFVLIESADEALVAQAAQSWSEPGESRITRVIDIEQF
jgi:hypothetical protein